MTELLPDPPRGALAASVRRALRSSPRPVAVALIATLLGSASLALGPLLIQRAIDDGITAGERDVLLRSVLGFVAVVVLGGVAGGVRSTATVLAAERFMHQLRLDALAGVLRLDLARFDHGRRGDLLARVTADTEALSDAARWTIPDAFRNAVDLVTALVAVAVLDVRLALVALVAAPPMGLAGRFLRRRSAQVYPRYRAALAVLVGQVSESIEGAGTVRAFGQGESRVSLVRATNREVTARFMAGTSMRVRFYSSLTVTRASATAAVVLVAGLLATGGRLSVGTAAAGVLAVSGVFGPMAWLTEGLDELFSAKAALERVLASAAIRESAAGTATLPRRGGIVLRGVDFAYVPGVPVLAGVDLEIASGLRVAIVGETGAGKSTLGRLVTGLVSPTAGQVLVGGVDLVTVDPADRRRRITFVAQEPWCFRGTLAENLRLVAPDATDDRLWATVRSLGLQPWVAGDPAGLERAVGPGGAGLSSGEQQLVGLLRVALLDPAVVVLDEATAVLDGAIEELVSTALDHALADRTVLVIAHRAETAARAPWSITVERGSARLERR